MRSSDQRSAKCVGGKNRKPPLIFLFIASRNRSGLVWVRAAGRLLAVCLSPPLFSHAYIIRQDRYRRSYYAMKRSRIYRYRGEGGGKGIVAFYRFRSSTRFPDERGEAKRGEDKGSHSFRYIVRLSAARARAHAWILGGKGRAAIPKRAWKSSSAR